MAPASIDTASASAGPSAVLVVGEALVDIVERPSGPRAEHVGGSPANVALGLGRLGVVVRLHTALGRDARGERIADHLAASGVAIEPASWSLERTSTAVARIGADGAAAYDFDLDWTLPTAPALAGERIVHVGSVGAFLEPGASVLESFLTRIGERAIVTFDPNIRPALVGDHAAAVATADRLAALANVVKLSDEDAAWLYPGASLDEVLDRFLDRDADLVAITLGGQGAAIASRAARVRVAAPPVTVVDTVGAGDTFMAALIDEALRRRIDGCPADVLADIGAYAAAAAGVTVQRAGADLPHREDL